MKKLLLLFASVVIFATSAVAQVSLEQRSRLVPMLKQLYLDSPAEGCRVVKMSKKQRYLVVFIAFDNAKYESPTQMQRVAQVKSQRSAAEYVQGANVESQTEVVMTEVDGVYKQATQEKMKTAVSANVKGLESFGYFDGPDNSTVFMYVTNCK